MFYQALADFVVLTHLAFIVFALLGGLLALRWHWLPWVHLPAVVWGAAVALFGWFCPLTPLENSLRRASGASEYSDSFIEHYFVPIIYPVELTREFQVFLGVIMLSVNLAIYWVVWRRRRARRVRASHSE
jgi:small-conductance mechanosensitive channel